MPTVINTIRALIMNLQYVLSLILLLLMGSCSSPVTKSESLTVLDLSQDISVQSEMTVSQIASDIIYTKLESNPDCFIRNIDQYSVTSRYILIYDRSQPRVLLFDRQGKFIRKIGNTGKGPGEYIQPGDARISRDERYILIFDYFKVMRFNFDGRLIGETKLPVPARNIETFDDGFIAFFTLSNSVRLDNYSVAFFDWEGNCTGKLLNRSQDIQKKGTGTRSAMFYAMNDEIRINGWYYDTVYSIRPDRSVKPVIVINDPHGKEERSMEQMNFQLDVWMETPDYLFFHGALKLMMHPMYLDKKTGLIFHVPFNKALKTYGIPNDLDGGAPFWPTKYRDGSAYRFQDSDRLKADLDHELIEKSVFKNQELRNKLMAFKESLTEEDGPVLIELKLK